MAGHADRTLPLILAEPCVSSPGLWCPVWPKPEIPADTLMAFSGKYVTLYEKVTGQEFEKPSSDRSVRERVRANLAKSFPEHFT